MYLIASKKAESSMRRANSIMGRKAARRRARMAIAEAIESRLLMSAGYGLTVAAAFGSSTGDSNGVVMAGNGDIYGTTQYGGSGYLGFVYELAAGSSTITTLATFSSSTGGDPVGTLIRDSQGNLYGVTTTGGPNGGNSGTIFELPSGSSTISVLASFTSTSGVEPGGGLVMDNAGNLFCFTQSGTGGNYGAIDELVSGASTITPLAAFNSSVYDAVGAPLLDSNGNLFGNSDGGGSNNNGTVFELASGGSSITTLASLNYSTTGEYPEGGLVMDSQGNLYGATQYSGAPNYDGAIFKVNGTTHAITALASFSEPVGEDSSGTLLLDSQGDLFGTSSYGGANYDGTVFELASGSSSIVAVASFTSTTGEPGGDDLMMGQQDCNLVMDSQGDLFGATQWGGANYDGTIFELSPLVANHVAVTQQPAGVSADSTDSVVVQLEDSQGGVDTSVDSNVTIAIATGPTGASMTGTATVAAVDGVATFSGLGFQDAGAYTLTISEGSLTPATTSSFTVSAGTATQLAFVQQPVGAAAGVTLSPVIVDVEDAYGNVVSTDSSSVTLTATPGSSTAMIAAQSGAATFSALSFTQAGTYSYAATDGNLTLATSNNFTITHGSAAQLAITQQPTNTTAGHSISSIIAVVEDAYGNLVTNDSSTLSVSLSGQSGATLFGTTTAVASSGSATFSGLSFHQAGQYMLTFGDGSLTHATTSSFTISPASAAQLAFAQQPAGIAAGVTLSPVIVDVEDAYGNVVTTDSSNITVTASPGSETAMIAAQSGAATFSGLSFYQAGNYTLTATDGSLTHATSTSFTISPGVATQLVFAQQPAGVAAGSTLSPVIVDVEDAYGNVVLADSSTVTLTATPGSAATMIAAQSGAATFSTLSFTQAGTYSYAATDGSLTSATSSSFTITPAAASQLVITQQPAANTTVRAVSPIVVAVEDAFGNLVTSDNSTLGVTLAGSGSAVLGGTTSVAASNGVATFSDLTISDGGTYTLTFAETGLTSAQSALVTAPQIPDVAAGTKLGAVAVDLTSMDQPFSKHEVLTAAVVSGPAGAKLWGGTKLKAINGQATFSNLVFKQAGTYTIDISDANGTVMQQTVTVAAGAANHLQFLQQPTIDNGEISTSVEVVDRFGNVVVGDTSAITLHAGPYETLRGGTLQGTATVSAIDGVATFSNLTVTTPGLYRLIARAAGDRLGASTIFQVL